MDKSKLFKAAGGLKRQDRYRKWKEGKATRASTFQGGDPGSFTSLCFMMKIKSSV